MTSLFYKFIYNDINPLLASLSMSRFCWIYHLFCRPKKNQKINAHNYTLQFLQSLDKLRFSILLSHAAFSEFLFFFGVVGL